MTRKLKLTYVAQIMFPLEDTALEHEAWGRAMEEAYGLGEILFLITQITLEIPKKPSPSGGSFPIRLILLLPSC